MALCYLDSSALVKLAVHERESDALRRFLRGNTSLCASAIVRTEVARALLALGDAAVARGREVLARIELVRVNDRVLDDAGRLLPPELRSLDAIHLATAKLVGGVKIVVTYDQRMASAARTLGFRVVAPK